MGHVSGRHCVRVTTPRIMTTPPKNHGTSRTKEIDFRHRMSKMWNQGTDRGPRYVSFSQESKKGRQ